MCECGNHARQSIEFVVEASSIAESLRSTALIFAVENGHTKIVEGLLAADANVNVKNKDNKTALIYAKEKNYSEIINLLKNVGATE